MLDFIRSLAEVSPEGPVVLAADRQAEARRRRLQAQAQQAASRIVSQAEVEATRLRAEALAEGYSQGVLQAAGDVAQALLHKQGMAAQLQVEVAQQVKAHLEAVLASPEWVETLTRAWLQDLPGDDQKTLQVVVPEPLASGPLRLRLAKHWPGALLVETHSRNTLLLRHGDQLLEFEIPNAVECLSPQVLMRLSGLRPAVMQLDAASANCLKNWVDTLVANACPPSGDADHAD